MESFGILFDEEWESLSRMLSDDHQDSCHFPGYGGLNFETHSIVSSEANHNNSSFINDNGLCSFIASENMNPNLFHNSFSQDTNNNNGSCVAYDSVASFDPYQSCNIIPLPTNGVCNNHDNSVDHYDENDYDHSSLLAQVFSVDSMEEILCLRQEVNVENITIDSCVQISEKNKNTPSKRKLEIHEVEDKVNNEEPNENPKKKTRVSRDNKNKKKVQPKKKQKVMMVRGNDVNNNGVDGEDTNKGGGINAPIASSSSCSSEDDLTGGAENTNWKTRASRGAATDPQSLYARKRRERINERLKVLQNLVPNGTKVDISTMLEEAVQYVKFLQLQIKLLSSDDMWMFAPIAYNGMDMGLYQKLSQSRN